MKIITLTARYLPETDDDRDDRDSTGLTEQAFLKLQDTLSELGFDDIEFVAVEPIVAEDEPRRRKKIGVSPDFLAGA